MSDSQFSEFTGSELPTQSLVVLENAVMRAIIAGREDEDSFPGQNLGTLLQMQTSLNVEIAARSKRYE